jgi:uncharacterized membrane protein
MKKISIILIIIGFLITGISSLGIFYALHTGMKTLANDGSVGLETLTRIFYTPYYLSLVNIFGAVILFLGVVLTIVAMFIGKKQQVVH